MTTKIQWDALWINACIATCTKDNHFIPSGAVAVQGSQIAWVGSMADLPGVPADLAKVIHDVQGKCLTPGFIDCHTHLVYAGNRAHEFEERLHGKTYEEIARSGGGIQSTVKHTRQASFEQLFEESLPRAYALMKSGVTTLEIKSGYGLDLDTEIKMLKVAKRIAEVLPITVKTTFLGAHTTPPEFQNKKDGYINLVCEEMIPRIAKENLADSVDVFCENIAFDLAQTEKVFKCAKEHGLTIKCHAEQLSNSGAAKLAANYGALSTDHLEHATPETIAALAKTDTVAVLLPGAFYCLRETKMPPITSLREHHVKMALASDCNPGTSPVMSLLLIMNFACTLYRLTPEEALIGVTSSAAAALNIADKVGSIAVGKEADFATWQIKHPSELAYYLGWDPLQQLVKKGNVIHSV